ncbi:hypothetical protein PCASD_09865 [Puccinia coronata f. sp. avenae]|uniref:Uncharacterized protein n=1 Tax=Puccinia coronata f. sp. avenae TaxID=200324 RepID=A0A2N5UM76_9BASI|nr:hypothetical protein PCASD_21213 [Puccinia coronata f. sp. avenae]PLW38864.1 hypothetical protein PCASD_09865 [Puccinia coronata f. sp. avenae]
MASQLTPQQVVPPGRVVQAGCEIEGLAPIEWVGGMLKRGRVGGELSLWRNHMSLNMSLACGRRDMRIPTDSAGVAAGRSNIKMSAVSRSSPKIKPDPPQDFDMKVLGKILWRSRELPENLWTV